MDVKNLDRIVITTNERMQKVLDWFFENQEWLRQQEFKVPMETGLVQLKEEQLDFSFCQIGEIGDGGYVEISVYPQLKEKPNPNYYSAVTFNLNPLNGVRYKYKFPASLPKKQKETLMKVILVEDETDRKVALKYCALMYFMQYYSEIVKVDESQNTARTKKEAKEIRIRKDQPLSLVRKVYVLEDFEKRKLLRPGRKHASPDHEFGVRGHWRQCPNGKKVWIREYSKCKGKGNKSNKTYTY